MSRGLISEGETEKECEVGTENLSYTLECSAHKPGSYSQVSVKQTESQGRQGVLGTICYGWDLKF